MDYSKEPHGVFMWIDNKSFYASVESIMLGLNPMKSVLVVLSENDNTNGGLILATSPQAKKRYNLSNVDRKRDLPNDPNMIIVPPRMNLYIKKNLEINQIFTHFTEDKYVYPYSIDESVLDMTHTWQLFGDSPKQVARRIQKTVKRKLGLYTTVGIGENPLQSKVALDILAKHDFQMMGTLTYETFGKKLWDVKPLNKVWSIGKNTAKHLNRYGIETLGDLAHTNPFWLKSQMGVIGGQLFAIANGIDRAQLDQPVRAKSKSVGNSQVLPHDYVHQDEIEVVIKEMGEQVASRLRHLGKQAKDIHLTVNYSFNARGKGYGKGFSHSHQIKATDQTPVLNQALIQIFKRYWRKGASVRKITVSYHQLTKVTHEQLDLFHHHKQQAKSSNVDKVIDHIREKFGNDAIIHPYSLEKGATRIKRNGLVGGHNGGNAFK
ncbi:Y-family DNA polymerase [Philodulcilactobacillus myokoensis]|uniref:Y-family DNA polymerase n=1 Tax=Philodulcilactobacillus myokoensis TaxID=2929573 RepID=UPI00256FBC2B|nr:Y-family DNA polymerase [Philodulcilactobacillus myokoensis]